MEESENHREVVHVAVGEDGYTSRSLVRWSMKNFPKNCLRVTHVFSSRKLGGGIFRRNPTVERLQSRRESVHSLLDQCIAICTEAGVEADKLYLEADSVEEGLLKLISSDNIKLLVIGAAASQLYTPIYSIQSKKAQHVLEFAPRNCTICFVCKGKIIHERKAVVETDEQTPASKSEPPSVDVEDDETVAGPSNFASYSPNTNELKEEAENYENELRELKIKLGNAQLTASAAVHKAKALEALYLKDLKERKEMEKAEMKKREVNEKKIRERELRLEQRIAEYQTELDELRKYPSILTFTESEINRGTCNFDESRRIGEGGYGIIYKGELHKTEVAVKVLREIRTKGSEEYNREMNLLQMMRHKNIITLIGVCPEKKALIYEYLPNGSLEDKIAPTNPNPSLTWKTRMRIANELCSALVFIHNNKNHCVVHCDVKPSNILFDENMVTKLSDFGICRLLKHSADSGDSITHTVTEPIGSLAYVDPMFLQQGILSPKSDVYSFGLVLLRLLTGIEAKKVMKEVNDAWNNSKLERVLDASAGRWPMDYARKMVEVAMWCTKAEQEDRPAMVDVWDMLRQEGDH